MTFSSLLKRVITCLSLLVATGCHHHAGRMFMGDPQNPYPLSSPPKVGDIVHMPTGTPVTLAQMLNVAVDSKIIYVGETHDNPASHRMELQALQALEERYPGKVALGMEMFVRSQQPVLDRWVAGELDEKTFVKTARWFDNWKMDYSYYKELLDFARNKHIPIVALNAEKSMVQAVRNKPLEGLSEEEKKQLPEMDLNDPYQRGMAEGIFRGHTHGKMHMEGFVRAQTLWDETMAESAVRYLTSAQGKDRHLLIVAGGNHVRNGFGIPRRVFRRLPTSYVTIGGDEIVMSQQKEQEMMDVTLPEFPMVPFDFLAFYKYETLAKQGVLLGIMFEPAASKRGMVVTSVIPDSNADRAGLKKGDVLVGIDGDTIADSYDLVYNVKQKHLGDRSTLDIERDGKPMKIEVVYQVSESEGHGTKK